MGSRQRPAQRAGAGRRFDRVVGGDVGVGGSGWGVLVGGTAVSVAVGSAVAVAVSTMATSVAGCCVAVGVLLAELPQLTSSIVKRSKTSKRWLLIEIIQTS